MAATPGGRNCEMSEPSVPATGDTRRSANGAAERSDSRPSGDTDQRTAEAQREWLEFLGNSSDAWLRSPMFLQLLKQQVDSLIRHRRGMGGPEGLSGSGGGSSETGGRDLRDRVRQLEERIASLEQIRRTSRRSGSSADDRTAAGVEGLTGARLRHGATPAEFVCSEEGFTLLRYRSESPRYAEPVLVCFALVNRPWVLDLSPERSVIRRLLSRGLDVYLIDWHVPTLADRHVSLSDYVCRRLPPAAAAACDAAGVTDLTLLGYCMGGTLATMFAALSPERVRNLVLLAAPIEFRGTDGLLNLWSRPESFDVDGLVDAFGNCPGELLQAGFTLMKPIQNVLQKALTFGERCGDSGFVDNFLALERWASDSVPVAGATFREFVRWLYQENRLVEGTLELDGRPVRLEAISCPLLLLVAEQDHLVPPVSTLALQQYAGSVDVNCVTLKAGHIGLAVSARAHRELWPRVMDWIAEHSTPGGGRPGRVVDDAD